jgi:hypothetical protein
MAEHRFTLRPSVPDLRDHIFAAPKGWKSAGTESLGVVVPFRDQGQEGVCDGFATTSAYAAALLRAGHPYREFSPAATYWWARSYEGTTGQDSGATIQDGLKASAQYGAAPVADMPYVVGDFARKPSAKATADAAAYRIGEYFRINHKIAAIQYAIHIGQPIVIGIAVYQSFEDADSQGPIPMPKKGDRMLGGHALYAHGTRDDAGLPGGGALIGDGSWGNSAPYELPYAYLTNPRLAFEVRTFALTAKK